MRTTTNLKISPDRIKSLLEVLGYNPINESIFEKTYKAKYKISVDFDKKKIIYPSPITLGDQTTSNFENSENFVVLECIDRLLEKGYPADSLSLEHHWPMGRRYKGKLDILVKDQKNKTYLMIECKTWGAEYEKEKNHMLKDGGQLLSYYQQDKNAQYLCLYTSQFKDGRIDYQNDIIKVEDSFRELGEVKEVFYRWNKQFSSNGIFDNDVEAYNIVIKALTKKDLKPLASDDSGIIYNHFLEILRHNVVSDKGNAFNKIFNLFLCKVLDEDKGKDEQVDFQWIEGQDDEKKLLGRLNSLYKESMDKYLDKQITDYTEADFEKGFNPEIRQIFEELRLYKNQEFAFIEVFNEESFLVNASIVKEVVQLLQGWQIRYTHKQQFLGEFFELLLNTGFKQESGQFFTPVPLVRFIIKSLPVRKIIHQKIKSGESNFLPHVIDFACGAGHFLTEMMDILQTEISDIDNKNIKPSQKRTLSHYKHGDFRWAKDFVYGIEKDYRLVKTTKLACFLHGDGEAKIIHASGLEPFNSDSYENKLKSKNKDNNQFDILVANPPYSVSGFRSTIKEGKSSFDLYKNISDQSSEIEVLFIERMKQLLKPEGVAGIILPQSILNKEGNYTLARKLLLENFLLKAIVLLDSMAFMETGTKTAILFLKKRRAPIVLNETRDYLKMVQNQKLVVIKSGEGKQEKKFLGYEFTKRRGDEGIKKNGAGNLVDIDDLYNPKMANSYILSSLLDREITEIDSTLRNNVKVMPLENCFDWEVDDFTNKMNPKKKSTNRKIRSNFATSKLKEISSIKKGKSITEKETVHGKIPVVAGGKKPAYYHNRPNRTGKVITVSSSGSAGFINYFDEPIYASDCTTIQANEKIMDTTFLYYLLHYMQDDFYEIKVGANQPHVYARDFKNFHVPVPPLQEQQKVINKLNGYRDKINSADKIIGDYKPVIRSKGSWKRERLGDIAGVESGGTPSTREAEYYDGGDINWATIEDVKNKYVHSTARKITERGMKKSSAKLLPVNAVLFSSRATIGEVSIAKVETCTNQGFMNFICDESKILPEFMYYSLIQSKDDIITLAGGMKYKEINKPTISNYKIPLPPINEQKKIIKELQRQERHIEEQKNIILQMEENINAVVSDFWE